MEEAFDMGVLQEASPAPVRPNALHLARLAAAEAVAALEPSLCAAVMAAVSDVEDEAFRWGVVAGALAVLEGARSSEDIDRVVLRAAELVARPATDVIDLRIAAVPQRGGSSRAPHGDAHGAGGRNWT